MSDRPEHDEEEREDEEGFQDALEDLGRSFTRFMQKIVEKSEELLGDSGLEDLFRGPGEGFGGGATGSRRKPDRSQARPSKATSQREPVVDVFDEGDEILIYVELPGVEAEQLDVQVQHGVIHLKARSPGGTFEKDIDLPPGASSTPDYHFKNGILKVQLKKRKKKSGNSKSKSKAKKK